MRGADKGAAAVEFALVVPILIFLLFGIIDYGLYFTNSLSVRSGASDAARQISVGNFSSTCNGAFSASGTGAGLISKVRDCVSPVGGNAYAKVTYASWTTAETLVVCAVINVDGLTGITPMPSGGMVTARVAVPIQRGPPDVPGPSSTPPLPGQPGNSANPSWFTGWC